jgi:hypothetical protein
MPADPTRFNDNGQLLATFLKEVWVKCPNCAAQGVVVDNSPLEGSKPHFTCGQCALRLDGPQSRWFGMDLALQAPCKGEVLWAYNPQHLQFIADYVSATLRERAPNLNSSLASRLPGWIKSAKNRSAVLKAIRQIEAKALR